MAVGAAVGGDGCGWEVVLLCMTVLLLCVVALHYGARERIGSFASSKFLRFRISRAVPHRNRLDRGRVTMRPATRTTWDRRRTLVIVWTTDMGS
jgi:hypothetical protein